MFGQNQSDLCIRDDCHKNRDSFANFPHSYNEEGSEKMVNSQESYRNFSGATQGHHFKVLEYEVYKVTFKWNDYWLTE